jgi:putative component of membrane protein insertase Oxa1/YidC/SpoIIIJ protein YidD
LKHFIRWLIRRYWAVTPTRLRRTCLFRETCSQYVYRLTEEAGARAGLAALWIRRVRCSGAYRLVVGADAVRFVTRDGAVIPWDELNSSAILRPITPLK